MRIDAPSGGGSGSTDSSSDTDSGSDSGGTTAPSTGGHTAPPEEHQTTGSDDSDSDSDGITAPSTGGHTAPPEEHQDSGSSGSSSPSRDPGSVRTGSGSSDDSDDGSRLDDAADAISDTASDISDRVSGTRDVASDAASDVRDTGAETVDRGTSTVRSGVDAAQDRVSGLRDTGAAAADRVGSGVETARETGSGFVDRGRDVVDDTTDDIRDTGRDVFGAGTAGFREGFDTVQDMRDTATDARDDVVDRGVSGAREAADEVQETSGDVFELGTSGFRRGRETVDDAAVAVGDTAADLTGGEDGAFGVDGISPGAQLSLDDPDAIDARAEQEQEILGWRDVEGAEDVPRAAVGNLFGAGQQVERAGVGAGGTISDTVPSAEVGPQVGDEHLGEVPSNLVGGTVAFAGMGAGAVGQLPGSATADAETIAAGEETPTDMQGGTTDLAQSFGETQVDMATDYPMSTAAGFALPGAEGVPAFVRGERATRGTSDTVEWGDITTARGEADSSPVFDTDTGAPTTRAIDELETRMEGQPDAIREQADGGVLFHTTDSPFGSRVDVGEGASEYPGIFASPEASPLGLRERGVRPSDDGGTSFGLGDYSLTPEQAPGFRPRDLDGIPERAAEPGYAVRGGDGDVIDTGLSRAEANRLADETGGDRVPDPTTAGYEFMTEQAPTETGMVRPPGDRTSEMEAIFAPDSQFEQAGAVGVEMPDGRTIRSDIYEPAGEPARGGELPGETGAVDGSPRTASEISESARGPTDRPDVTAESAFGAAAIGGEPTATEPTRTDPDSGAMESYAEPTTTGELPGATTETTPTATGDTTTTDGTGTAGTTASDPAPTVTSSDPTGTTSDPTLPGSPTATVPAPTPSEPTPSTTPSEPAPSGGPSQSYADPFGMVAGPAQTGQRRGRRRRRDDEGDPFGFDAPEPVDAESPEYTNPIASGFESIFDDQPASGDGGDDWAGESLGPFG